jgi:hypothetical protein
VASAAGAFRLADTFLLSPSCSPARIPALTTLNFHSPSEFSLSRNGSDDDDFGDCDAARDAQAGTEWPQHVSHQDDGAGGAPDVTDLSDSMTQLQSPHPSALGRQQQQQQEQQSFVFSANLLGQSVSWQAAGVNMSVQEGAQQAPLSVKSAGGRAINFGQSGSAAPGLDESVHLGRTDDGLADEPEAIEQDDAAHGEDY